MKNRITQTLMIVAITGLYACGTQQTQMGSSNARGEQNESKDKTTQNTGDAEKKIENKASEADATGNKTSDQSNLACPGVAAHEGMDGCDQDDRDISNNTVPTKDVPMDPAKEPVKTEPTTPTTNSNIVEFRIKAGTGMKPWNTQAETVVVKVGQTLRIYNDDTITHRLHTGGAPCAHGNNFLPGASFDCVISKPLETGNKPTTYDHTAGTSAFFWLRATAS